jgi:hypothetical protein
MRIVGSGYDFEEAERNGCCISLALGSLVHFSSLLVIYNLSNAFNASSAVLIALAELALVTTRPPAKAMASQGLGGETSEGIILAQGTTGGVQTYM